MSSATIASAPRGPGDREFVALMALIPALQALAIDAMLPALGAMARDLGASDANQRQLIVAVFLIGIGAGSLFPGPLSDRYGRRPVLFVCLAGYVLASFACMLARDIETMLALRLVQAMLGAGLGVLPAAIIRDRVSGDRMARLQSLVFMVFMAVPMFAPSAGQAILLIADWRWIFGLMGMLGAVVTVWAMLRLPETLRPENTQGLSPVRVLGAMGAVLTTRASIGYVLASAMMMSGSWGFINSSQQLMAEHFGLGAAFPLAFGMMALGMALANYLNSRIVERFGARRVSQTGLFAYIAVALVQVGVAAGGAGQAWLFIPLMGINFALIGFTGANFQSIAIQPFARMAGAASSLQMFLRTLIAALVGAAIGQAFDGTARPLAHALLALGLTALALILFSERGKLFTRVYPRGSKRPQL